MDLAAPKRGVGLVEQPADGHVDLFGIAKESLPIGGGELERLGVRVKELERSGAEGGDVIPLEEVQSHWDEWPLRPRAAGVHVDAAIGRVDRRFDPDPLLAEVRCGDGPSGLTHERGDLVPDVALVDRVACGHDRGGATAIGVRALGGDEPAEQRSELPLHEDLPDAGRTPVRQEHRRARRPLAETLGEPLDRRREPRVHREAVAELDRRREHLREREPAMAGERGQPGVRGGRGDRSFDPDGHVVAVARAVGREVQRRRPVSETVDRLGFGHPRAVDDDRRDAAEIREMPLEHVERDPRGDAGVDRVPASFEHPRAGERREVMARAHHVPGGEERGPALPHGDRWRGVLDRDLAHAKNCSG